jgi:hypothetical protein
LWLNYLNLANFLQKRLFCCLLIKNKKKMLFEYNTG